MQDKLMLDNLESSLIIITGMAGSGKTTLANKIVEKYKYLLLSMDDYKVELYEKYGFINEVERKRLWNLAKETFCAEIIFYMRQRKTIIVEYPFDETWQDFFDLITKQYQYKSIVIKCDSREFDDIWTSRVKRDLESNKRPKCLTASKYIKDVLYESNNKLSDENREKKRRAYKENKYTSIKGDIIISDKDIKL